MFRTHGLDRLIGGVGLAVVVLAVYLVLEVLDRVTASPAMRSHVNKGSEKFFAERGSVWKAAVRSTREFLGQFSGRF